MSHSFDPPPESGAAFRNLFGADTIKGGPYAPNRNKYQKVTEDGMRIVLYPDRSEITCQFPGQSHSAYAKKFK